MSSLTMDFSGLGPRKSVFVVIIVVGCFSVLWPKIFHPMLMGLSDQQIIPNSMDKHLGCCDVMFSSDMNAVVTVTNLCAEVLRLEGYNVTNLLSSKSNQKCRAEVLSHCGLDISPVFSSNNRGPDVKAVKRLMSDLRSLNGSSCLQVEFGVPPWLVGAGHRPRSTAVLDASIRQERPPHLRGDLPHPAMRERGRAIPAAMRHIPPPAAAPTIEHSLPKQQNVKFHEGRPGPIPGMRPPMGGAGHMTPAKPSSSPMGVLMPLYTIAIVIFFVYTLMKILFKKPQDQAGPYSQLEPDPVFRRRVFGNESILNGTQGDKKDSRAWHDDPKLVVTAIQGLVADVDRRTQQQSSSELTRNVGGEEHLHLNGNIGNGSIHEPKKSDSVERTKESEQLKEDKPTVKILGMEMTARCEGGQKWSRPSSPVPLPVRVPQEAEETHIPQSIYLEGTLPHQSQLLVSESETHTEILPEENDAPDDPPVVLSGKMTLSVINLDNTDNVESHLEPEDENAVLDDGENLDDENDNDESPNEELDMTDDNINELEDEDIQENIESIEVVMTEDINMN